MKSCRIAAEGKVRAETLIRDHLAQLHAWRPHCSKEKLYGNENPILAIGPSPVRLDRAEPKRLTVAVAVDPERPLTENKRTVYFSAKSPPDGSVSIACSTT